MIFRAAIWAPVFEGKISVRRFFVVFALLGLMIGLLPASANAQSYSATASATWIPNAQVRAMVVTSTRIYIGGDFTSLTNPGTGAKVTRNHIAALDRATGNPVAGWNPSVPDGGATGGDSPAVGALMVNGSTLYVGGDFKSIDGQARNYAAALDTNGNLTSWNPHLNDRVWDFAMNGSNVVMVGLFGRVNVNSLGGGTLGVQRRSAALVNATNGQVVTSFDAQVEAGKTVQTVLVDGNTTYLGGTFTTIAGGADSEVPRIRRFHHRRGHGLESRFAVPNHSDRLSGAGSRDRRHEALCGHGRRESGRPWAGLPAGFDRHEEAPLWTDIADGDVQAVAYYDGTVYFGGHFDKKFGIQGHRQDRKQFAAVDPANGEVRGFKLPFASPSKPGIWDIAATASGIWVAGGTHLSSPNYKNFLAFSGAGQTVPGPVVNTHVDVKTKGCKTCKVRLVENRGSGAAYSSGWKKAKNGKVAFNFPTIRTKGLTVQIDAPWQKGKKTAEAVMRYKGQGVGDKVSKKEAEKAKKATSCYAGTGSSSIDFTLKVKKAKSGGKVGTRAWAKKTQRYGDPMRKAKHGVLATKSPTKCS